MSLGSDALLMMDHRRGGLPFRSISGAGLAEGRNQLAMKAIARHAEERVKSTV